MTWPFHEIFFLSFVARCLDSFCHFDANYISCFIYDRLIHDAVHINRIGGLKGRILMHIRVTRLHVCHRIHCAVNPLQNLGQKFH